MAEHQQQQPLSFVLIPLMGQGHIIPMIDMAKSLATHNIIVTVIVTPLHASRFADTIRRTGLSIRLLQIKFPVEEFGLPPGCESSELLPSLHQMNSFFLAINTLQKPIEETLKSMNPIPNCIICDKNIIWMAETCARFNIPRIIFDGMSCFSELIMQKLHFDTDHDAVPLIEPFVVADLPDRIELTRPQCPGILNPGPEGGEAHKMVMKTELQAYGLVVNTFEELEKNYVNELRKARGGKVWTIGPLSLFSNTLQDRADRGDQASIDAENCLKWLDSKKPGSVIYACLGSLSRLPLVQFIELASALESSKSPFILVAKQGTKSGELERWMEEENYGERTKQKGLVIKGWAPQLLILSHPSVGGFITHCGWNSILEGISTGVPLITWPLFAEQFLNEKLVLQILRIGVGVGARRVAHLGDEQDPENIVPREAIVAAIRKVQYEGDEMRSRAQEFAAMAKRSVQEGGSSHLNVTRLKQEMARFGGV